MPQRFSAPEQPAGPAPESTAALPRLEPAHDIVFTESDDINAVLFLPDSDRAIVQLRADAVDLWPLAVHYWPEILGTLVGLLIVFALWRLRAVLRRPQRRGEPHCRRCNYNLSAHVGRPGEAQPAAAEPGAGPPAAAPVRCPECGVDVAARPPRRGRSAVRRLAPVAVVVVVVAGSYIALHALGLGRRSGASEWFSVPSARFEQWRSAHGLSWMDQFSSTHDLLIEFDAASGKIVRRIGLGRSSTYFAPAISPDGSLVTLSGGQGSIDLVSTRSGRRRATFRFRPDFPLNEHHRTVRFAPGGESLYIAHGEGDRDRLVRWWWRDGRRETVVETAAYQETFRPGDTHSMIRRYELLNRPEGMRILATPSFSEAYPDVGSYLRIYSETGDELAHHPIEGGSPSAIPVVTPDGRRLFIGAGVRGIAGFDLEAGEPLGYLQRRSIVADNLAISPDGRLLAVPTHQGSVLLRDIEAQRWIAELRFDDGLIAPVLQFSRDGRWLSAVPFKDHAAPGAAKRYVRHLLIFDLSQLETSEAATPGATQAP